MGDSEAFTVRTGTDPTRGRGEGGQFPGFMAHWPARATDFTISGSIVSAVSVGW